MGDTQFAIAIDELTLERFRRGDRNAFEAIYRRFRQPAYGLALRLVGAPDRAGDVLQEAMLKAWRNAASFRAEAPFWAWLRRIVVNEALMHVRSRRRWADAVTLDDSFADDGAEPWRHADADSLERAVMQLPDDARAVLWLYHVEGFTHAEIAAQFGRSESFSKSCLARATRRLRRTLQPECEVSPCLPPTTIA